MAEARIPKGSAAGPELATLETVQTRTRWGGFRQGFLGNKLALFGTVVMAFFVLMAIFAPLLAPYDPVAGQNLTEKVARSSAAHILWGKTSSGGTSSRGSSTAPGSR